MQVQVKSTVLKAAVKFIENIVMKLSFTLNA